MAKEVKPRERGYLKRSNLEFNGVWTVDGNSIHSVIVRALEFFETHRIVKDKDVTEYFNVAYTIERLHASERHWNPDIIRSWIDMFHDYMSSAVYLDAFHGTQGGEKPKFKAAESVFAEFQKTFA